MWLVRGYLYNLCCGEFGCIYYRQVCLPIGFAWLCEMVVEDPAYRMLTSNTRM